jgi:hypothetical protein
MGEGGKMSWKECSTLVRTTHIANMDRIEIQGTAFPHNESLKSYWEAKGLHTESECVPFRHK